MQDHLPQVLKLDYRGTGPLNPLHRVPVQHLAMEAQPLMY